MKPTVTVLPPSDVVVVAAVVVVAVAAAVVGGMRGCCDPVTSATELHRRWLLLRHQWLSSSDRLLPYRRHTYNSKISSNVSKKNVSTIRFSTN